MNRFLRFPAALAVILVTILKFSAVSAEEVKLSVGWIDWAPYKVESKGMLTGLDVELINAIFNEAELKPDYVKVPWKRTLLMVKDGSLDVATSALKTKEREVYAHFSDSYRKEEAILYVQSGKGSLWNIKKLEDIRHLEFKLGITRGYSYGDKFDSLMKLPEFRKNIEIVNVEIQNFRKLKTGRIDGLINEIFTTRPILEKYNLLDSIEPYPLTVYSKNVHVMFSKASTNLGIVNRFNRALKKLTENGDLEAIEKRYR